MFLTFPYIEQAITLVDPAKTCLTLNISCFR